VDLLDLFHVRARLSDGIFDPYTLQVCTLLLSLDRFLKFTSVNVKSSGQLLPSSVKHSNATLSQLRAVLSVLLTPGLSPDIDEICESRLGIFPSSGMVGVSSYVGCLPRYTVV
jgi:hypothetical protein